MDPGRNRGHGRSPADAADPEQFQRFLEVARELGCDPADPRIQDVLRGMAALPHQPRRKGDVKGKRKRATKG